jgi:hypothetical protein
MPRAIVRAFLAGAVAWVAFLFRFQAPEFHNDHFEHLSMARQVLFGELPGRDFFDPGRPLTVLLSAAAQALSGQTLLGEALLTIGALALGAAIVFWMASGLSRSLIAGVVAAMLVIVISPRLYSYPKILVFAVSLLAVWRYARSPSIWRAVALAAATVFALLMRHDFGLYVGIVSAAVLMMVRLKPDATRQVMSGASRTAWHPIAAYALACAVLVAPYLAWMQYNELLASSTTTGVGSLVGAARLTWRPLRLDLSHGLVHLDPVRGQVTVRWAAGTTDEDRRTLEERYALVQGHAEGDRTFSYAVTDDSRQNIRALVADPHVEDTGGINRGAAQIDSPAWNRWLSRLGVSRLVVGPFFSAADAEAWLYYVFWLIPIVAITAAALQARRAGVSPELITLTCVALLGVLLNLFLLRGSLDSRLPDVVVPAAIAGAWLAGELMRRVGRLAAAGRFVSVAVSAVAVLILGSAVFTYSGVAAATLLRSPTNVAALGEATRFLRRRPIETWSSPDNVGVQRLTQYVFECTAPEDRLLLVAYEPQVFYYAERLFAGGIEHFHQRRFSSAAEQARIVADLRRQRVPLVIVDNDRYRMLQDDYADVLAHVSRRYQPIGESTFGAVRSWRIYADRTVKATRSWDDLPCFR